MTEPGMAARTRSQIPEVNLKLNNIHSPQRKLRTNNYYKITCDPNGTVKTYPPDTSISARVNIHEHEENPIISLSNNKPKQKEKQSGKLVTSESESLRRSRQSE